MPSSSIRHFRRKEIDFSTVMQYISEGKRIEAKKEIDTLFRGLTNLEVGYGILKMIEATGELPADNVLEAYIIQRETADSTRKVQAATLKAQSRKQADAAKQAKPTINVPQCPTCGSTDLTKIGAGTRAIDGFFFGRLSVEGRAQWRCNKCSHMW